MPARSKVVEQAFGGMSAMTEEGFIAHSPLSVWGICKRLTST